MIQPEMLFQRFNPPEMIQYYRDESFKYKIKTGKTPNHGNEKNIEIMVSLKYLSNFWRNLEMSLINCEVNLI